jgi:hypothetical protein
MVEVIQLYNTAATERKDRHRQCAFITFPVYSNACCNNYLS